jgi:nucleoside-diphosphate-sugar epimerase
MTIHVFLAGASGAIGSRLVPALRAAGHQVTGMTRSRPDRVCRLGAEPVVADALDADAVTAAVAAAQPDAIVHQLTALSGDIDLRHLEETFAQTNRLRTEGTDNLLAAAREAGVRRFVAQSYAGWYRRVGGSVKTEEDPLDLSPKPAFRTTVAAIRHLENAVTDEGGIVLRYGGIYGPGTALAEGAEQYEMVRKRKFPLVGSGAGVWSFIHVDDAASATVAALEHGRAGIYNVVDDDPATVSEWLPALAGAIGAKPPRRVPRWIARPLAGETIAVMMTESRGASNAKARRELGWVPRHRSWREGFVHGLSG